MVRSERAGVAGQGQDRPGGGQTVVVISAPGEEKGGRELTGLPVAIAVRKRAGMARGSSSDALVFEWGERGMDASLRETRPLRPR